jgi:hypothetical protein
MFDLLAVGSIGALLLCLLLPASAEVKRENLELISTTNVEVVPEDNTSSSDDEEAL